MKNKIIKIIVSTALLVSVNACAPKEEAPVAIVIDKEQIKKDIQAREDEFSEVYNSGKIKDIGYYGEDATVFHQNRAPLVGKAAIVAFLEEDLESNTNSISFKTNEVFVSNDGIQVIEVGSYKVTDSVNVPVNTGNYMCYFEKRDGKYVCVREMSATDMPLE
jgi:ketosteroid isomerase-like protein